MIMGITISMKWIKLFSPNFKLHIKDVVNENPEISPKDLFSYIRHSKNFNLLGIEVIY